MNENLSLRRRIRLAVLLVLVVALFFLGWSQASLNLSFLHPNSPQQTILLLALSTFIFLAFVIFALILFRILLKLYVERRRKKLGSRFKTKMVVAFLGLSLVPVCFLFAFAYGLLNRSIDKWFGIPLGQIRRDVQEMVQQIEYQAAQRAWHIATRLARNEGLSRAVERGDQKAVRPLVTWEGAGDLGFESAMCFDATGRLLARAGDPLPDPAEIARFAPRLAGGPVPPGGLVGHWRAGGYEWFAAAQPVLKAGNQSVGTVVGVTRLPVKLMMISDQVQREAQNYEELAHERKALKRNYLSMLWLLTLLILFIATWFALFLSKQVTIPIQALAEGTHEVSKGNLGFQVVARSDDELGLLIQSFNEMTRQLQENRRAIEQAAQELQEANRQLEERGNTIEALLQNIPTGVISFNPEGYITRINSMARRMFGLVDGRPATALSGILPREDAQEITHLFRQAARQGVVTRQMEMDLGGRRALVAVTISSVRARHEPVGSVLVLEDLSELVRAQKAAAWGEVAQRIAHEIKNPLTPIQLSAERIRRLIERAGAETSAAGLLPAINESAALIEREIATLKTLVDEFSAFTRFPASRPVPSSLNPIVETALRIFDGRLTGIAIHRQLAPGLPLVSADAEQIKRAVVNLIDNAAEALELSPRKEIWVGTALEAEHDVVEIVVADSGPGIPLEAKERLFLPYFSTKRRGTGLGLAIVNRIVAEHNGSIRVEENQPAGTKFIIELPVERAPAESAAPRSVA
jgi:two-component system, NtrC family, nitrogen regulation sensor histidine kinase NtrY